LFQLFRTCWSSYKLIEYSINYSISKLFYFKLNFVKFFPSSFRCVHNLFAMFMLISVTQFCWVTNIVRKQFFNLQIFIIFYFIFHIHTNKTYKTKFNLFLFLLCNVVLWIQIDLIILFGRSIQHCRGEKFVFLFIFGCIFEIYIILYLQN
jgi:hypothetical protein